MKILHCYYMHLIFITHIVRCSSIFLSSCVNFYILTHKFLPRYAHCHHTHFIFITKQSIFVSFISHIVAKNISHAHYVAKLRTFLLGITNFLSITNNTSAFLLQRRNAPLFFVTYVVSARYSSRWKIIFCNSTLSITLSVCKNIATYAPHTNQNGQKNNILLQDNY